jgi:hypothetical protein
MILSNQYGPNSIHIICLEKVKDSSIRDYGLRLAITESVSAEGHYGAAGFSADALLLTVSLVTPLPSVAFMTYILE